MFERYVQYQPLSPEEITKKTTDLQSQLEAHLGQQLLVVTRTWDRFGLPIARYEGGCFGGYTTSSHRLLEEPYLGIVDRPYLTVSGEILLLHTPRTAYFEDTRFHGRRVIMEENRPMGRLFPFLPIDALGVPLEGELYGPISFRDRKPGLTLEVVVGDQAVEAFFRDWAERHIATPDRVRELREGNSPQYNLLLNKQVLRDYETLKAVLFSPANAPKLAVSS